MLVVRLGIIATVFLGAVALCFMDSTLAAKWVFALFGLLSVEAIMFRYYSLSSLNIRIGKAKDSEIIKGRDTYNYELLCVPVSLRFTWWEVKGISFRVKSNGIESNSELFGRRGGSLEKMDGTVTLDWRLPKGYACLAFCSGTQRYIGNPVILVNLPHEQSYPIILEVLHYDKLVASSCYNITIIDGKMELSDKICEEGN